MLETVGAVIAAAKHASELAGKAKDAALKTAIAEVVSQAADLKLEAAELKSQMSELIDENRQLKESLRSAVTKESQVKVGEHGLYFKDDGDGPFCTKCHDDEGKLIRVTENPMGDDFFGKYLCPKCSTMFGKGNTPPGPQVFTH